MNNIVQGRYCLALNERERSMDIQCLNNLRNNLIVQGKYTDGVDDVLVKIIGATKKCFKIIYAKVWFCGE